MFLLFQDTTQVVDTVLKASPLNTIGYGLALLAVSTLAYVFYKRWRVAADYNRELNVRVLDLNKEMIALMVRIEQRLDDQKNMSGDMGAVRERLKELNKKCDIIAELVRNNS